MVSVFAVRKRPPLETWKALLDFGWAGWAGGERQLHGGAAKHINSADAVAFAGVWEGWVVRMGLAPSPGTGRASPGPPALPVEILTACLLLPTLISLNTQQAQRSHGGIQKGIFPF